MLFSVGLALVMLSQGMALRLADLRPAPGQGKAIALTLGLRFVLMPLIALGVGWIFGLGASARLGLLLGAVAAPSVAALPLGGLMGAALPGLSALVATGTVAAILWLLAVSTVFYGSGQGLVVLRMLFLPVILPFAIGLILSARPFGLGRLIGMAASAASVAMVLGALILGAGDQVWPALQAAITLAIAAFLLAVFAARASGNDAAPALALLVPVIALPVGLLGATQPEAAMAAALTGIASYLAALVLLVLRRRG